MRQFYLVKENRMDITFSIAGRLHNTPDKYEEGSPITVMVGKALHTPLKDLVAKQLDKTLQKAKNQSDYDISQVTIGADPFRLEGNLLHLDTYIASETAHNIYDPEGRILNIQEIAAFNPRDGQEVKALMSVSSFLYTDGRPLEASFRLEGVQIL